MKRFIIFIIAFSFVLSAVQISASAASFTDISGHWAEGDIEAMAVKGIVNGYEDGRFRPDEPITRAEFAKIISELYGLPVSKYGYTDFDDVAKEDWFAPYVPAFNQSVMSMLAFYKNGGWFDERYGMDFRGNEPLVREEAARYMCVVCNFPDQMGNDIWGAYDDMQAAADDIIDKFTDAADFIDCDIVVNDAIILYYSGLMIGDEQGRLGPFETMTRAQMCALLNRAVSMYSDKPRDFALEFLSYEIEGRDSSREAWEKYEVRLNETAESENDSIIVAKIGGEDISLADFNTEYYSYVDTCRSYAFFANGGSWDVDWETIPCPTPESERSYYFECDLNKFQGKNLGYLARELTFEHIAQLIAAKKKAEEYGLPAAEYPDKAQMKLDFADSYHIGTWNYYGYIDKNYTSDRAVEWYMQLHDGVNSLMDYLSLPGGPCHVTDEEIRDGLIKSGYIFIPFSSYTEDEALVIAKDIISRLDAGESADRIDPDYAFTSVRFMKIGNYIEAEMGAFSEAAELNPGEHSQMPVHHDDGYYIYYRLHITPDDREYERRAGDLITPKFNILIRNWGEKIEIQVYEEVLNEVLKIQNDAADKCFIEQING